uniref:Uncharacterized protein n=1 Tax=Arundo donax TaxID=35708 RepID=A0A0A9C4M2_ARUDO
MDCLQTSSIQLASCISFAFRLIYLYSSGLGSLSMLSLILPFDFSLPFTR